MRTAAIDDVVLRLDAKQATDRELRIRAARLRRIAQMLGEIAEPASRGFRARAKDVQFG